MIDPEEERSNLLSILGLVEVLSRTTGKTEQQAAGVVLASLARDPEWKELSLLEWQPGYGCADATIERCDEVKQLLARWASAGSCETSPHAGGILDQVGFDVLEIYVLLTAAGVIQDTPPDDQSGATPDPCEADAESLAAVQQHNAVLQKEIDRLRDELKAKADEVAMLSDELDKLKADALEGMTRTSAMKIIGGMAVRGYRIDIHAERLSGIGEVVEDLQHVGASVTEKTLRKFLKGASEVIDRSSKKA